MLQWSWLPSLGRSIQVHVLHPLTHLLTHPLTHPPSHPPSHCTLLSPVRLMAISCLHPTTGLLDSGAVSMCTLSEY